MRTSIIAFVLLTLLSCTTKKNQSPKIESVKHDSSNIAKSVSEKTDTAEIEERLANYAYDRTVYDEYLPPAVKTFLTDSLSGWKLPDPSEWDNLWFQEYKSPNALVDYISGDFNGDKKRDFALLLADTGKAISAWVIQSGNGGFTKVKLEDFGVFENHILIGLETVGPGKLEYIDPEHDDAIKPINLTCNAIQIEYFETTATTYYWENGKYNSVFTGD